ncbi:YciI family protein [Rhodococcus sp. SJ-3]|uniref:YciI family protein n=1 Tax=Rhodococcus sp. SJ-3 TaxID=3454628 RepID=UPI003F7A4D0E
MDFLALLVGPEIGPEVVPGTDEFDAEVALHDEFGKYAGAAIVGGAALYPSVDAVTIRRSDGAPLITDGPFAELAEVVVGGFYVFAADDLDTALDLTRRIPGMDDGYTELWPLESWTVSEELAGCWLAVVRDQAQNAEQGTVDHSASASLRAVPDAIRGVAVFRPPSSATTVRTRGDEMILSDGPEDAQETVIALYILSAPDRAAAADLACRIPVGPKGSVEVRRMVDE